jgi:hypothetical protein
VKSGNQAIGQSSIGQFEIGNGTAIGNGRLRIAKSLAD